MSRWLALAVLLFAPSAALAQPQAGELFGWVGDQHAGQVHLKTAVGVVKLNYTANCKRVGFPPAGKPTRLQLAVSKLAVSGWGYGSLWKFQRQGERLSLIRFTGLVDSAVQAADALVRHHFLLLAGGKFERAYQDLGLAWRRQQTQSEFVADSRKEKLSSSGGQSFSLVVTSAGPREVQELVYVPGLKEYYRYVLVRSGKKWEIDHVDQVSKAEFDRV